MTLHRSALTFTTLLLVGCGGGSGGGGSAGGNGGGLVPEDSGAPVEPQAPANPSRPQQPETPEKPAGPVKPTDPIIPPIEQVTDLASARRAWNRAALDDYQFTYSDVCYCEPLPPIVILVKDDAVDSAFFENNGEYLSDEEVAALPTIDSLFDRIQEAYDDDVALVEASYNSKFGFPEDVFIDFSEEFVDEESGFTVTDFQ